jgi:glycolate oxidase FAD binding subunit
MDPDRVMRAFAADVGDTGPVAVEGARTRWGTGGDPTPDSRLVRAPAGIVEHRPEEMTVRVRAGTPVEELHAELAAQRQRTALPRRGGTVGGALAIGENDLCVLGRGRVRDAVLQVRYVSAEGAVVTGGGPMIKNVTGYDLPRLLVGSLGTLGCLGEAILRTNPIPAVTRWFSAVGADPFAARDLLLRPSALLFDGRSTWVQLEGHTADVDADRRALSTSATVGGRWAECEDGPALPPHRWSLRPSDLRQLDEAMLGAFVASIGTGLVFASRPAPPRLVTPSVARLASRVKREFDPSGRLNPGRTVANASPVSNQ